MLRKLVIFSMLSYFPLTYAELCPSVQQIKLCDFQDWNFIDMDNGTSLSPERREKFIESVTQFAFAEWMDEAPEGSGHCYYHGIQPDSDFLGVFLAKPNLVPLQNSPHWKKIRNYTKRCDTNLYNCQFLPQNPLPQRAYL